MMTKAVQLRIDAHMEAVNKAWKGQPAIYMPGETPPRPVAAIETVSSPPPAIALQPSTAAEEEYVDTQTSVKAAGGKKRAVKRKTKKATRAKKMAHGKMRIQRYNNS